MLFCRQLKEQYAGTEHAVEVKTAPPLLEGILRCKPAVFTGKPGMFVLLCICVEVKRL